MKSYNHLWEQFISDDNYYLAVKNATKHKCGNKKRNSSAKYYKEHKDELKDELLEFAKNFTNDEHMPKTINDGISRKKRTIYIPTMREQIIHHMVVNVLKPIFMKGMYEHSYGSIPGRGSHMAKKRIEKWIRHGGKNFKYVLKIDIKKYFDSVPHDKLKAKFSDIIHDNKFLSVLYEIIDVVHSDRGIPIGFYTSQWIANWYLQGLDHYIKEILHVKYHVRYMDDMVMAGSNKRTLHKVLENIKAYLSNILGLEVKENWQVFKFDYNGKYRDIDFMGFRFYRNRTILRKSIALKASRKAKRISKNGKNIHSVRQMLSYIGWVDCTDTYSWFKKFIKPRVSFRALRHYESRWQKQYNIGVLANVA